MGHDVFISHSSKDKAAADAILEALESAGVKCWIAPRDILPGDSWASSILKAIGESRLMVIIISSHTATSSQVVREVERAVHHAIPVAPIRIEDVMPRDDLEYFLSASHWMDAFIPPLGQHLPRIAAGVRSLIAARASGHAPEVGTGHPATVSPVARPAKRRTRRVIPIALLMAALLIAGAIAWGIRSGRFRGARDTASTSTNVPGTGPGQARMKKRFDLMNAAGMRFVRIDPGEFQMGSPPQEPGRRPDERRHRVRLTQPFLISIEEVTKGQFAAFVKDSAFRTDAEREGFAFQWNGKSYAKVYGASWLNAGYDQDDAHPVVNVSWSDAVAFCRWLSTRPGNGEGRYRLPTEAEWEYACRAGSQTAYPWGDSSNDGAGKCNVADLSAKSEFPGWETFNFADGFVHTAPTGQFSPNQWGLYDLQGNVLEWCSDWYGEYAAPAAGPAGPDAATIDPTGPATGTGRALRGGSWADGPAFCRAAARRQQAPEYRSFEIGFRVAVAADPAGTVPSTTRSSPAPASQPSAALSRLIAGFPEPFPFELAHFSR
jgi:formylglycine-generating enzyme required for sulfatase activity